MAYLPHWNDIYSKLKNYRHFVVRGKAIIYLSINIKRSISTKKITLFVTKINVPMDGSVEQVKQARFRKGLIKRRRNGLIEVSNCWEEWVSSSSKIYLLQVNWLEEDVCQISEMICHGVMIIWNIIKKNQKIINHKLIHWRLKLDVRIK